MNVKEVEILNARRNCLFTKTIKKLLMKIVNAALQFSRNECQRRPLNCKVSSDK
jgi:hypothetical protein